jgi:hypothetical protein
MENSLGQNYVKYHDLINSNIDNKSIQELFDHRFEVLNLRETLPNQLDEIEAGQSNNN